MPSSSLPDNKSTLTAPTLNFRGARKWGSPRAGRRQHEHPEAKLSLGTACPHALQIDMYHDISCERVTLTQITPSASYLQSCHAPGNAFLAELHELAYARFDTAMTPPPTMYCMILQLGIVATVRQHACQFQYVFSHCM